MNDLEKQLFEALQNTLIKLIEVCPIDLAGDKEIVSVITNAEAVLDSARKKAD